jgi:hypothetical protein
VTELGHHRHAQERQAENIRAISTVEGETVGEGMRNGWMRAMGVAAFCDGVASGRRLNFCDR